MNFTQNFINFLTSVDGKCGSISLLFSSDCVYSRVCVLWVFQVMIVCCGVMEESLVRDLVRVVCRGESLWTATTGLNSVQIGFCWSSRNKFSLSPKGWEFPRGIWWKGVWEVFDALLTHVWCHVQYLTDNDHNTFYRKLKLTLIRLLFVNSKTSTPVPPLNQEFIYIE